MRGLKTPLRIGEEFLGFYGTEFIAIDKTVRTLTTSKAETFQGC
jgi:hypothetical protein